MHIYLVGGAVRDELLHIKGSDRDFCVEGSSPEELEKLGFKQVGKDFPVFLHPKTNEEYALCRTERKNGHGYTGFICDFSPEITLEEDLKRRDLTINAIAKDENGQIVDPLHGVDDLKNRILRHVGPAFLEDPLRVLRLARFYARFKKFGFTIAEETKSLCIKMTESGELSALTPERVWLETEKALKTDNPECYFEFLEEIGALKVVIPEIQALKDVPENTLYHPEGNTFAHTMLTLKEICKITKNPVVRFGMLVHDFGKTQTPKEKLPNHNEHRKLGSDLIRKMCTRLRIPNEYAEAGMRISRNHSYLNLLNKPAEAIEKTFHDIGAYRFQERIAYLSECLTADYRGRKLKTDAVFPEAYNLVFMFSRAAKIKTGPVLEAGFKGVEIGKEMTRLRCEAIKEAQEELKKLWHK